MPCCLRTTRLALTDEASTDEEAAESPRAGQVSLSERARRHEVLAGPSPRAGSFCSTRTGCPQPGAGMLSIPAQARVARVPAGRAGRRKAALPRASTPPAQRGRGVVPRCGRLRLISAGRDIQAWLSSLLSPNEASGGSQHPTAPCREDALRPRKPQPPEETFLALTKRDVFILQRKLRDLGTRFA